MDNGLGTWGAGKQNCDAIDTGTSERADFEPHELLEMTVRGCDLAVFKSGAANGRLCEGYRLSLPTIREHQTPSELANPLICHVDVVQLSGFALYQ